MKELSTKEMPRSFSDTAIASLDDIRILLHASILAYNVALPLSSQMLKSLQINGIDHVEQGGSVELEKLEALLFTGPHLEAQNSHLDQNPIDGLNLMGEDEDIPIPTSIHSAETVAGESIVEESQHIKDKTMCGEEYTAIETHPEGDAKMEAETRMQSMPCTNPLFEGSAEDLKTCNDTTPVKASSTMDDPAHISLKEQEAFERGKFSLFPSTHENLIVCLLKYSYSCSITGHSNAYRSQLALIDLPGCAFVLCI